VGAVSNGVSTPLAGISVAETGASPVLSYTVTLTDVAGLLSATGTATITGSGTTTLGVKGTVAQVNATLATLTDVSPSDQITVTAVDANSNAATPVTIPVRALPSTNTYLVYSSQALAQSRSQTQCATVNCDAHTTYWWNIVGPLGAGTAGVQIVTDGSYAVEIQATGWFAPTVIPPKVSPCAVGCGLSPTEQQGLVTAVQLAPLLTSGSGAQTGSVAAVLP